MVGHLSRMLPSVGAEPTGKFFGQKHLPDHCKWHPQDRFLLFIYDSSPRLTNKCSSNLFSSQFTLWIQTWFGGTCSPCWPHCWQIIHNSMGLAFADPEWRVIPIKINPLPAVNVMQTSTKKYEICLHHPSPRFCSAHARHCKNTHNHINWPLKGWNINQKYF